MAKQIQDRLEIGQGWVRYLHEKKYHAYWKFRNQNRYDFNVIFWKLNKKVYNYQNTDATYKTALVLDSSCFLEACHVKAQN